MKIYIEYFFTKNPWGGANQFLKALRNEFLKSKKYSKSIFSSDIIIVNSHHFSYKVLLIYLFKREIKIIHRIDGPISMTRDKSYFYIDHLIHLYSKIFADGVIFQSLWSKSNNIKLGFKKKIKNIVIKNSPDKEIFFRRKKKKSSKIRIIASSWSSNYKKGFKFLKALDSELDFSKYEFLFVGNSPITFKNIKKKNPIKSAKLSKIYSQFDYFLTGSKNDPCSNSLLEAIQCGLIPIYLDSGGHKEIAKNRGIKFKNKRELFNKIRNLKINKLKNKIDIQIDDISKVAKSYFEFTKNLKKNKNNLVFRFLNILYFLTILFFYKIFKKSL